MKSILRSSIVQTILSNLIWAYMAVVGRTLRWQVEGMDKVDEYWDGPGGMIVASWHSQIVLLPAIWTQFLRKRKNNSKRPAILISLSRDGEFVARAAEKLGLRIIRGSSGNRKKASKLKGGVQAIREVSDFVAQGNPVCLTVDGPRGPRQRASSGAIVLAQRKQTKIMIYAQAASPAARMNSWDRLIVPMPFGKGAIVIGDLIDADRDIPVEDLRLRVEAALNRATQRASELVGAEYEPPAPLQETKDTPAEPEQVTS